MRYRLRWHLRGNEEGSGRSFREESKQKTEKGENPDIGRCNYYKGVRGRTSTEIEFNRKHEERQHKATAKESCAGKEAEEHYQCCYISFNQ